jgi:hypothetical protein
LALGEGSVWSCQRVRRAKTRGENTLHSPCAQPGVLSIVPHDGKWAVRCGGERVRADDATHIHGDGGRGHREERYHSHRTWGRTIWVSACHGVGCHEMQRVSSVANDLGCNSPPAQLSSSEPIAKCQDAGKSPRQQKLLQTTVTTLPRHCPSRLPPMSLPSF